MAAGEDQAQPVVRLLSHGQLQLHELVAIASIPPQLVQRPVARHGQQPRPRIVRDARKRPAFERDQQCVLDDLLGEVEVAQDADQRGGEPSGLVSKGRGQDGVRLG